MLGVVTALNKISTEVKDVDGKPLKGYHFDLKAANILVDGDEPRNYVFKIADFGLAGS